MLVTGIMEMKHANTYIDVTEFTDEEILEHPIFIHNFVMCILSIFVMTLYLIQAWVLFDQWQWVRKRKQKAYILLIFNNLQKYFSVFTLSALPNVIMYIHYICYLFKDLQI